MNDLEHAIDTRKAAALLGLSAGTLAVWRSRKQGPPVHYSGARPVYFQSELREWQRECRFAREKASAQQADVSTQVIEIKESFLDGGK
jgi:hypothetical protein